MNGPLVAVLVASLVGIGGMELLACAVPGVGPALALAMMGTGLLVLSRRQRRLRSMTRRGVLPSAQGKTHASG